MELIGAAEVPAGFVVAALADELGLSQPATSQHLKVLRETGLVTVRAAGTSRLYRIDRARLEQAAAWFDQFADPWQQPLDALETELARGRRDRSRAGPTPEPGTSAADREVG